MDKGTKRIRIFFSTIHLCVYRDNNRHIYTSKPSVCSHTFYNPVVVCTIFESFLQDPLLCANESCNIVNFLSHCYWVFQCTILRPMCAWSIVFTPIKQKFTVHRYQREWFPYFVFECEDCIHNTHFVRTP
jgi:hypothetical protein